MSRLSPATALVPSQQFAHRRDKRVTRVIDDAMSIVDFTEQQVSRNRARAGRLRQAILKWAFEGKLADQDPNDEPASALLERIRAARETSKPQKKARRRVGGKKTALI